MQKYSKYYSNPNNNIVNAIYLRLIKIVNTIPFGNRGNFAINQSMRI